MLELDKNAEPFFHSDELLKNSRNAKIIPICLGTLNLDKKIKDKTLIRQLGWGIKYEESPLKEDTAEQRDPIYSSCMTSQAGPEQWRFQNCDMKRMKKMGINGKDTWKCDKINPPPDYQRVKGRTKRCRDYFDVANNIEDKLNDNKPLSETWLKDIDFILVEDKNGIPEKCYNEKILLTQGWCYLKDYKEKDLRQSKGLPAWGTCSSSCKDMEVSCFLYTDIRMAKKISRNIS